MNILVTGAGNGLGHAFVNAFSQRKDTVIHAIDRTFAKTLPSNSKAEIRSITLDIINESDVISFGAELCKSLSQKDQRLDLVIHSAGVRGLVPSVTISQSSDVAKAETIYAMDAATMVKAYEINAVGTFLLLKALVPCLLLKPSASIESGVSEAKVMVMGSRMGSIGSNVSQGGAYAYRASKAAVNAVVRSFAVDVPEVVFVVVHPGRVETGLVNVKEDGAMSVEESIADMLRLVEAMGTEHSGTFVDRLGVQIPW